MKIPASKTELIETFRAKESEYSSFKKQKSPDPFNISAPVEKLFNMFSGLSEYLKQRYLSKQIKKQKMINDENYEKQKKKKQREEEKQSPLILIFDFIIKFLHFFFLIVFAYLSVFSTSNRELDNDPYIMRKMANDIIKLPNINTINNFFSTSIISNIYNQLLSLRNQTTYFSFIMLTPIRFTFVNKNFYIFLS
jgi:hypothetical protein